MLTVYTDIANHAWLQYILEEFCRIQHASFSFEIVKERPKNVQNLLIYAQEDGCHIEPKQVQLNGELKFLQDNLFVLSQSEGTGSIPYDLLWNAFVFLSRLEEYQNTRTNSYSNKHIRSNKTSFDIPVVNVLFTTLEKWLSQNFQSLKFGAGAPNDVHLSHDLDYITKTPQLRIKQTAFNAFNILRSIHRPKLFWQRTVQSIQFFFRSPSYWCFDYWTQLERSYGVVSTFYVFAKGPQRGLKSWLLDPSYDVKNHERLRNKLKEISDAGFHIGLHGSFYSAESAEILAEEKQILEAAIGKNVTSTRQHWLRYNERITPKAHEKLFNTDATLGWNDRMGFRSGCCSLHRPYNHEEQKPFDYMVIPQVIMDSNIYDYNPNEPEEGIKKAQTLLLKAQSFKNSYVSISWHPRTCSSDYNWHIAYETLLKTLL
jgi:peptidoglycan/xylan/chitin deacetylase (PgdA/CDA1 family)